MSGEDGLKRASKHDKGNYSEIVVNYSLPSSLRQAPWLFSDA